MTNTIGKPASNSPVEFAASIGLEFSNPSLLARSLTHSSYLNEHPEALEDNERLEFLGDAVLDFVVGAWLYHRYPEKKEGDLTRIRAALVRTEKLAEFGREINLGPAINLGHGEEESGGRTRDALLCGTFEALVGALYLDSKIAAVEEFISPFLQSATDVILSTRKDRDAKGMLQEWVQAQGYLAPEYVVIAESGPDHDKSFTVEVMIAGKSSGVGSGSSKQTASKAAAKEALKETDLL